METKLCKYCQTEIPKKAKVCPNCRKKQGGVGKWIVIALVVVLLIGVTGGSDENSGNNDVGNNSEVVDNNSNNSTSENGTNKDTTTENVDDKENIISKGDVFGFFKHALHNLGGQGSPGAVFYQGYSAVLEIPVGEVMDKFLHKGENVRVVGSGSQNQLTVTEGIFHSLCHITAG